MFGPIGVTLSPLLDPPPLPEAEEVVRLDGESAGAGLAPQPTETMQPAARKYKAFMAHCGRVPPWGTYKCASIVARAPA